jgi:hypothetical protein
MITTAAFNRAYGWSGDPICVLYRSENVVIGPANKAYTWVAFVKERSTAMVLRVSSPTPQRSCRKCGTFGAWFLEPPSNELATNSYFSSMPRFVINHPDYWYRSAKAAAESISKVLWLGLSLAITAIVLKLIGESKFTVQGVQVPLGYSAIPFAMLTAVHLFCANQFVRSARRYWELTKPKQYGELFKIDYFSWRLVHARNATSNPSRR